MASIEFGCRPTIIGSMPHTDPIDACNLIARHLRDIPTWPQLPHRAYLENMYVQFSEGFPGIVIQGVDKESRSGERIFVDRTRDLTRDLEQLYSAYLEGKPEEYRIGQAHAAGLYSFLSHAPLSSVSLCDTLCCSVLLCGTLYCSPSL